MSGKIRYRGERGKEGRDWKTCKSTAEGHKLKTQPGRPGQMEGVGLLPSMSVFVKEGSGQLLLTSLTMSYKGG